MSSWSGQLFPELDRFENKAAQKSAFKRAYFKAWKDWRNWAKALGFSALAQVGVTLTLSEIIRFFQIDVGADTTRTLASVIGGGIAGVGILWVARKSVTRDLRTQLNEAGQPTCMACGYDLRTQAAGNYKSAARCPECGKAWASPAAKG